MTRRRRYGDADTATPIRRRLVVDSDSCVSIVIRHVILFLDLFPGVGGCTRDAGVLFEIVRQIGIIIIIIILFTVMIIDRLRDTLGQLKLRDFEAGTFRVVSCSIFSAESARVCSFASSSFVSIAHVISTSLTRKSLHSFSLAFMTSNFSFSYLMRSMSIRA
jgi:hypothetical protein